MVKNNKSRIRRRKLEREAVLRDYEAFAEELGLKLIKVHGVRPEVFYDAVDLLIEAGTLLQENPDGIVFSKSPETGIEITVTHVPISN